MTDKKIWLTWPWRAVRRLATKRPIRFTRFGTFYILFSLAVGGAAINTGNNLLYLMLGLLLGFIIISGILSDSCLWGLKTRFRPVGDFFAGQPAEWDLEIRKGWFPAIIVTVEAFWDSLTTRHLIYWIPRHGEMTMRISHTPDRRGMCHLRSLRYATSFPFGLFEKSRKENSTEQWVVFPAVKAVSLNLLRAAGVSAADQPAGRRGWGATPFDLREYRDGDSNKRIHWKSTAKRGRLMVTEMEDESGTGQTVIVRKWPAETEAFISFVASLLFTLFRNGERVGLRTPGAYFTTDRTAPHLKSLLTYLALVDPPNEKSVLRTPSRSTDRGIEALDVWQRSRPLQ